METRDVFSELGLLSLGSRLKRLSDQMMYQVSNIYQHRQIPFEPSWLPVFSLLQDGKPWAITDISQTLGLAHPSVIQITNAMIKKGVAISQKDPDDSRRRLIRLTQLGKEMLLKLTGVWEDIRQAVERMMQEAECDLLQDIKAVENVMNHQSMFHRVERQRQQREQRLSPVQIVAYDNTKYRQAFRDLNVAWVSRWFTMEAGDYEALDHPQEYIVDTGGAILIALLDGEPVGTSALIKVDDELYELSKMCVSEKARGNGVGLQLGQAALAKAQELGAKKVKLYSNKILKPALRLYEKLGFQHVPLDEQASKYTRSNVKMEWDVVPQESLAV
ncbi:MAG: bifunctional helix-turn-helix transcriptional regulator/GNAT family N-acetyltransferase [Cyclobacteriaceae bacterium]|jgi:GNAT superfamily N-acetyltransferase/DNA-binding MarR family transcriptional regulator